MQISEHLIAYQTVSLAAYQRLRETLIQQKHVFESVTTEATVSHLAQTEGFVLMCSPTLNVLLTAVPIASENHRSTPHATHHVMATRQARSQTYSQTYSQSHYQNGNGNRLPEAAVEYRVGLTFDDRAIAVFLDRLKSTSMQAIQREPRHMAQPSQPVSEDDKWTAQKAFVLSWAKNLATSPEGDTQPTQAALDNQRQQRLLLDQVINRIHHSLDLPAILERTVAQVREFLLADRLVLYQFDHFEALKDPLLAHLPSNPWFSNSVSNTVLSSGLTSTLDDPADFSEGHYTGHYVNAKRASSALGGVQSHAGHVTYESRASEDVSSVLHLSECDCFEPSLPMKARYLLGQPVSVDNVERQYGHIPCLLGFLKQSKIKSKVIAPIVIQGQLWGLLIAHQCHNYRHWEDNEAIFLQHVAEHLAVAISQSSLYQQLQQQTVRLESCVIERTQNLQDALMAAESANLTKGEFLSTMSHELRTPLTYIIGMSATLLRWSFGDLNDRQRSYLNTINQSGEQLLGVINGILEFASVESGRSLLDFSELSLSQLASRVISHHQEMSQKQAVTLALDFKVSADQDLFRADAGRLEQIISNLIHNAIKFTGSGGGVDLRVWRESGTAFFQVEDTGIGIPESQRDILFEKFKQLESPFQRQYSGMGLGLAMTKRLVELHGGSIQVDSQVGKGSTFTVRLPVQPEPLPPQHSQTISAIDEGTKRIVLLEKDEDNAAIACEMLTAAGYEVIWLIDSEQLAVQLDMLRPVMLIADLSLINSDAGNIRAMQLAIVAVNTKVLALTTHQSSAPSSMAHHDTLPKPIDPKALLAKVLQLLAIASS